MEKIISINFQGRVIPIEETAYNNLKQYIDSLRRHFATEESGDEIVTDIENRIAELLSDRLKHGAPCIMMADVSNVIDSIGRLEDIEAAESEPAKEEPQYERKRTGDNGRFFRNEDDKVIAGVCSGIAIRTGIDPVIVRILFVVLSGALFWIYILLWIIVPSQSIQSNITRRLYRNPDDKMLGGVCGGLAAYFNTNSRTIRAIFLVPFIISIISAGGHFIWWHFAWSFGPHIVLGSLGSTFFVGYIILWLAVPYAVTAADKMEMRGEKIDMNSIKAATMARAGAPVTRRHYSGLGRIVGIVFKSFFLFLAGSVAAALFGALIGLVFGGVALMPYTDFFVDDKTQYIMLWAGFILLLGVPMLAFITWGVRRIAGIRSRRNYLGYIFAVLWIAGFFCVIILGATVTRNFSSEYSSEEIYPMSQPTGNKLYIIAGDEQHADAGYRHSRWYRRWNSDEGPFRIINNNTLWINTVRVKVTQSPDSMFHLYKMSISRGGTPEQARVIAGHIDFRITQQDSVINLPKGFTISEKDKFRNQQVVVVVEVPLGKSIQLDRSINDYDWFTINVNRRRQFNIEGDWSDGYYYRKGNKDLIMTVSGLRSTNDTAWHSDNSGDDDDDE